MRFTTLTFLLFFVLVYLLYWSMRGRSRLWLLGAASMVFYGAWSPGFLLHFVAIVLINFGFTRLIRPAGPRRKLYLTIALLINFSNLFLLKYFYFFLRILFDITGVAAFQTDIFNRALYDWVGETSIVLPLAISFYTFQISAYLIDEYRNQIPAEHGFIEFFVFILFFPQLVAGPIMRHGDFFPQLDRDQMSSKFLIRGMTLIQIGLIKKVAIADNIVGVVKPIFANPEAYDGWTNVLATIGFAAQVYCDFSGYTDLARGFGYMFGLKLPENFYGPYLAPTVKELWQRWHSTLSTWMRDYLYIPLGGSRTSRVRADFNLVLTFTLSGLWHGANYTYILWGFMHGVALIFERYLTPVGKSIRSVFEKDNGDVPAYYRYTTVIAKTSFVFFLFLIGVVFFNAPGIEQSWAMFVQIFSLASEGKGTNVEMILGLFVVTMGLNWYQYTPGRLRYFEERPSVSYPLLLISGLLVIWILGLYAPGSGDFIYFQF
ncbi:MAG: MBOAT family O-acyltransferase [Leptospiraceae bacterium]